MKKSERILLALESIRGCIPQIFDRNFVEISALLMRKKKVVRLVLDFGNWIRLREIIPALGIYGAHANFKLGVFKTTNVGDEFTINCPWTDLTAKNMLVYLGLDQASVEKAFEIEWTHANDHGVGQYLGYPSCCIKAYQEIVEGQLWIDRIIQGSRSHICSIYGNKLGYLFKGSPSFLPDYYPCTIDCRNSALMGYENYLATVDVGLTHLANSMRQKLFRPILYFPGLLVQFKEFEYLNDKIQFNPESLEYYDYGFDEGKKLMKNGYLPLSLNENDASGSIDDVSYQLIRFIDDFGREK